MRSWRRIARPAGFTLIELMVTVSVIAILAVIAVPAMRDFTTNNQVTASKSAFVAAVALARAEAARQGVQVNFTAATGSAAGTNDFSQGWVITLNDATKTSLRQHEALPNTVKIVSAAPAADDDVAFGTTGYLVTAAAHRYTVCSTDLTVTTSGYTLQLDPSGVIDVEPLTCTS